MFSCLGITVDLLKVQIDGLLHNNFYALGYLGLNIFIISELVLRNTFFENMGYKTLEIEMLFVRTSQGSLISSRIRSLSQLRENIP